ncbi:hypothetical protein CKO15_01200 [Halorhodospira abdelmalekii]|uniref:cell division protein ZipA C-terminal FtsZ-binding domain-containing protein n=1 Tax=Halorhodospira abdelmalekii TaxID=421629 RepID=UPI0019066F65|nr:cell division protein ZipA C-terminal FtsZ-binding domain-containing protein [Halorhodospira abdelmalekii]MBK1733917.1 hypothetical protein [Halorhodospira abdelmalekii]
MEPLRWIILGVGLLVLLAIYLLGRRRERRRQEREAASSTGGSAAAASVVGAAAERARGDGGGTQTASRRLVDDEELSDWGERSAAYDAPFIDEEALQGIDELLRRDEQARGDPHLELDAEAGGRPATADAKGDGVPMTKSNYPESTGGATALPTDSSSDPAAKSAAHAYDSAAEEWEQAQPWWRLGRRKSAARADAADATGEEGAERSGAQGDEAGAPWPGRQSAREAAAAALNIGEVDALAGQAGQDDRGERDDFDGYAERAERAGLAGRADHADYADYETPVAPAKPHSQEAQADRPGSGHDPLSGDGYAAASASAAASAGAAASPGASGASASDAPPRRTEPKPLKLSPASQVEMNAYRSGDVPQAEKIVALYVAAREGERFDGPAVAEALEAVRMVPGEHRIWHRRGTSELGRVTLFSVASMVEPGYLDPEESLPRLQTPGLAFFMQLPLPVDGEETLDAMMASAYHVSRHLDGLLLDRTRSTLTRQVAEHLREQLREHRRQLHIATHKKG